MASNRKLTQEESESTSKAPHDFSNASTQEQRDETKSWISIKSVVSGKEALQIGLDHEYLKDGILCSPNKPGATHLRFSFSEPNTIPIQDGSTLLGRMHIFIENDASWNDPNTVNTITY